MTGFSIFPFFFHPRSVKILRPTVVVSRTDVAPITVIPGTSTRTPAVVGITIIAQQPNLIAGEAILVPTPVEIRTEVQSVTQVAQTLYPNTNTIFIDANGGISQINRTLYPATLTIVTSLAGVTQLNQTLHPNAATIVISPPVVTTEEGVVSMEFFVTLRIIVQPPRVRITVKPATQEIVVSAPTSIAAAIYAVKPIPLFILTGIFGERIRVRVSPSQFALLNTQLCPWDLCGEDSEFNLKGRDTEPQKIGKVCAPHTTGKNKRNAINLQGLSIYKE